MQSSEWETAAGKGWGRLVKIGPVIQGWKSEANQAATKRGKNSKHQATSTGGDHTGCPLPVWFSSFTNQHVTVKRGVKNGTKGLAKPFINLPDQPDSEGQANGLLIRWASHEQHKARWKETKPREALRRAVGYALHHGVGGRAEFGLKPIQNPDPMWLPSHEGVRFNLV